MEHDNIYSLLVKRCEILDQHQLTTSLMKSKENLKDVIMFLRESVINLSNDLSTLRMCLNRLHEESDTCKKLFLLLQELNERIIDMYANTPEGLITEYLNISKNELAESSSKAASYENISSQMKNSNFKGVVNVKKNTIIDCKKELFNESEPEYPRIPLLKEKEFNEIPKYMIGRQTMDKINSLVININKVLQIKYSLLFAGKDSAKKRGLLDTYLNYKKQDIVCENCGAKYFFTAEDYENSTKTKLDRAAYNMMTALRHCKRIREYRSKKELYYIILK